MLQLYALLVQGFARAALGDSDGARASADAALAAAADLMEFFEAPGHAAVAVACQAAGDYDAAKQAYCLARQRAGLNRMMAGVFAWSALAPLACGDVATAAQWADETVVFVTAVICRRRRMTRAQVKLAQGEMDEAEQDAQAALLWRADDGYEPAWPPTLECLAGNWRGGGEAIAKQPAFSVLPSRLRAANR